MRPPLSIIGIGNLGYHLALALHQAGYEIREVYSRTREKALEIAQLTGASMLDSPYPQVENSWTFICLPDDLVRNYQRPAHFEGHLIHCSGNVALDVLSGKAGVFYPLQSFSRSRKPDFNTIPILLESNRCENPATLERMALSLSQTVREVNSAQRAWMHLGAVFVNNFTNAVAGTGMQLAREQGLDAALLLPLLQETVTKISLMGPDAAQTGPALRGDAGTLEKHLQLLKAKPELQDLYRILSELIRKQNA